MLEVLNEKPKFWLRILGAKRLVICVKDGNVEVKSGRKAVSLPIYNYSKTSKITLGRSFGKIAFNTESDEGLFHWVPNKSIKKAHNLLIDAAHKFEADCLAAAEKIKSTRKNSETKLKSLGYPRHSKTIDLRKEAREALSHFKNNKAVLDRFNLSDDIQYLERIINLSKIQQEYEEEELEKYNDFFDHVESRPLTQRQREACVIDEESNLVLAGAGSGKTSVMIGRAGYLIKSGAAKPEEILMLAFASDAAKEMQQRIEEKLSGLGNKLPQALTFHTAGIEVIVKSRQTGDTRGRPAIAAIRSDSSGVKFKNLVNQWHEQLFETDPNYRKTVFDYFGCYQHVLPNPFEFESLDEYKNSLAESELITLKGDKADSFSELQVANYLFCNGVEYEHGAYYEYDTATAEHRTYKPDFYLPRYSVYIKYQGIDRAGNTAPYVDREAYHQKMAWNKEVHKEKGTKLIELFHYELTEGTLFDSIDRQLKELGVEYKPVPAEEMLSKLTELGADIKKISEVLISLIDKYKENNFIAGRSDDIIEQSGSYQLKAAAKMLMPILKIYEDHIGENEVDFNDMINKAIECLNQGFQSSWKYILVDEFQDISDQRAELLLKLKASNSECSLFGVGDDWQAIYRFAGSNLLHTTNFENKFGRDRRIYLDKTFRYNNSISEVSSRFVLKNHNQINKDISTLSHVSDPAVSVLMMKKSAESEDNSRLDRVLAKIRERIEADTEATVYVLTRYNLRSTKEISEDSLKEMQKKYAKKTQDGKSLIVTNDTIHKSKGQEKDFVVVFDLEPGDYGFPSTRKDDPLFEPFSPEKEDFEHAEERRLFYVALTRARHRVYLVADINNPSEFVIELLKDDEYNIETGEFGEIPDDQKYDAKKACPVCKLGQMRLNIKQYSNSSNYRCSRAFVCDHIESACDECEGIMQTWEDMKVCTNLSCGHKVNACPYCKQKMILKPSKFKVGDFFESCSEWGSCPDNKKRKIKKSTSKVR